jgi:nitroreductase
MPDFFEVLKTRRTIRSYQPEPLSDAELQELIDMAVLAPSGMNSQPWAFTVILDRAVLRRLNEIVTGILRTPEILQRMPTEAMRNRIMDPAYDIFYGAPALIVISGDAQAPTAAADCHLAAENLFLAAHALGLGTCYMGFLMFAQTHPEVRRLLRLPEGYKIVAPAVVGRVAARPEGPPQRRPPRIEWVR